MATYLNLNDLEADYRIAKRLPAELAYRYRALPLAENGGCITVAMANPEDREAQEAITVALGSPMYVVRASPEYIHRLIAKLWPEISQHPRQLLLCEFSPQAEPDLQVYSQNLAASLGAQLHRIEIADLQNLCAALHEGIAETQADLVICKIPEQPGLERLIKGSVESKLLNALPVSILFALQLRWPLKTILLVIRNEQIDDSAIDWTVNLAKHTHAAVTVLPLIVPVPAMYRRLETDQTSLAALLSTECALGRQVRDVARRLVEWEIDGTLRLRNEAPTWQINREINEGDYDLVVIAAERVGWLRKLMSVELVYPLLTWLERPILVTKQPSRRTESANDTRK